jgi:O-acetyl-ADP-ribose deacetylase (regulator of RNase III)
MKQGKVNYVTGDATRPQTDGPAIIVHVCNDIGGWGKGFVMALSRRWPEPELHYRHWYADRDGIDFALGAVQLVQVENQLWVANLVGQRGLRRTKAGPPIRYDAIETGLAIVADNAAVLDASVHMPRIGCGLAGGKWEQILPILERTVIASGIDTYVYDLP